MILNIYKFKIAMAKACITINELSQKSNVSRYTLNKYTSRKSNPKPATLGKIAKALNVPVEELID